MKLEAFLCPVLHNATRLVWETSKSNHMAKEVSVAYTSELNKKGKSQQAVNPTDDAWEASDQQK